MTGKQRKGLIILLTPFLLGFLLGILAGRSCSRSSEEAVSGSVSAETSDEALSDDEMKEDAGLSDNSDVYEEPQVREIIYHASRPPYAKWFADLNEAHLDAAARLGLKTIPETRNDIGGVGLVRIEDNRYYMVDNLKYSAPYLTKGAKSCLDGIAKAFADSLKRKDLLDYKLVVSSVLRTEEDVRRLKRSGNPNASDRSAHCYGTTFDITYTRYHRDDESDAFMQPYELTKVLGEVLRDQKRDGKCLIKYEKQEHCFHITSLVKK